MSDLVAMGATGYYAIIVTAIIVLDIILMFAVIFLERKNPSATLTWLFVLLFLPVVGIVLYFLLSQNISRQRVYKLSKNEVKVMNRALDNQIVEMKTGKHIFSTKEGEAWNDLIKLNQTYAAAYYTQNNKINIITDGNHMLDTLIKDIEEAKHRIDVEFFIIKNDYAGKRLIKALTKKAAEGLDVRLLLDAVGSRGIWESTLREYAEAGGKYSFFFKNKLRVINLRLNYRNHRKIVVIDGRIGYVGGFNIGREYLGRKKKFGYWRDTQLRLTGGAVNDLMARFLLDWRTASGENVEMTEAFYTVPMREGKTGMQIVSCGPNSVREEVKRGYMKIITSSRKNVFIQTPYFVPDGSVLESLKMAAQSGVDVRVMIPSKPDHPFVYWATLSYAGELVRSGGRVFIYDNGFLHAKTIVADSQVASVGSTNFDIRSFRLNFETNAFIFDADEAKKMENIFESDMALCHELTLNDYNKRSNFRKFRESISRLLSDIL